MESLVNRISNLILKKRTKRMLPQEVFELFRTILQSNNRAFEIIADLGEMLSGDFIFDKHYITTSINELKTSVLQSVKTINCLYDDYTVLYQVFARLSDNLDSIISGEDDKRGPLILHLEKIASEHYGIVGGKCANLAAIIRLIKLKVPAGFCLTTNVYYQLIEHNDLQDFINHFKASIFSNSTMDLEPLRQQAIKAILHASPPPGLLDQISQYLDDLSAQHDQPIKIAVRSSAREEDSDFSFAGQLHTELGVSPNAKSIFEAYLKVVASMFSRKAIEYIKRIFPDYSSMSIACCCQIHIDAAVSGVMYTADVASPGKKNMTIAGIWGQGLNLVEGNVPSDTFEIKKEPPFTLVNQVIQRKNSVFKLDMLEGIKKKQLDTEQQLEACLTREQLQQLGQEGLVMENYFNRPQDIEWCFDRNNSLYILQSRPLRIAKPVEEKLKLHEQLAKYELLVEKQGLVAQQGIATGPVFLAEPAGALDSFPEGAILVGRSDSSRFVRVMHKASAIITEIGTPVSHMATLCREFHVPCLVNVPGILKLVNKGMEITIDTEDRLIYKGRVSELLTYQMTKPNVYEKSKETTLLRRLIGNISRLHLVDPFMDDFTPKNCQTYHDLLRFIHEKAVLYMVNIGKDDKALLKNNLVKRLRLPISTGILLIDIGDGISRSAKGAAVSYDEITSTPFKAILTGLLLPGIWHQEAMSIGLRDIMNSMLSVPTDLVDGHYAGRNIAVITHNYVNLCFRFGYHFNIIDAYCDTNTRENHIYFRFLGGATDITKRSRRARLIAEILQMFDFRVKTKGDLVIARIGNKHEQDLEQALNVLGRLIGFTRQLDVHMNSDEIVDKYVDAFMHENYDIQSIENGYCHENTPTH